MPVTSPTSSARLATSPTIRSSSSPLVHQGLFYLQERLSQLEQDLKETRVQLSNPKEPGAEPQLRDNEHSDQCSTCFSGSHTRLIHAPSEEEPLSKAQAGFGVLSDTGKKGLDQESIRLQQERITADLEQKYQAQIRQTESDIIDACGKALIERDTSHQLEIEKLRTDLNREHKLQFDKKAQNIRANHAGILNKKEIELQNLTSELYDANQQIRKLKNSTRSQQHAFEDPTHDIQAKLHKKIRNIHSNNASIIAKKDAQYQRLSKELENAHQLEDAYQAELALTKKEHESEKVQLKKDLEAEHGAEIEALREAHGREMAALKSGEILRSAAVFQGVN